MSPRRLIPLLGAALVVLAAAPHAGAVVGGVAVPIEEHPYQVAILSNDGSGPVRAQYCGGSVYDARHIITAAHCVYDTVDSASGQAVLPGAITVFAGSADLNAAVAPKSVSAVSFDPRFDTGTLRYDAAVLTLTDPLPANPAIAPIQISSALPDTSGPGANAFVTGWGATLTDGTGYPTTLQGASISLESDAECQAQYSDPSGGIDGPTMVCGGDGTTDACAGDSGGPLVQPVGPPWTDQKLVGIVSFGFSAMCADPLHDGVYTEVPASDVRSYLELPRLDAPRNVDPPTVNGPATAGEPLTCATGVWSGSPDRQDVQWLRGTTLVGTDPTYTASDADVGSQLRCVVKKANNDGFAISRSAPTATIAARPTPAPAEPAPAPAPAPVVLKDTAAPVAKILTARCVKQTCTITLRVTDAGVSAGIAKVTGSVRSTYRRDGRTRHRTRTFTARRTASTRFTVRLTKLPVGTQLFSLLSTDKAAHRQLLPTRKTLKTRR
ncbi:MAG: serine protease [Solirubrobacteraceae bacterium]